MSEPLRTVVLKTPFLSVVRLKWPTASRVAMHSHPGPCLFGVFTGKLVETRPKTTTTLYPGQYTFCMPIDQHSLRAPVESVSYHVYIP